MFTIGLDFNISLKKSSIGLIIELDLIFRTFLFLAALGLYSRCSYSVAVHQLLIVVASPVAGHGLSARRLQ